MTSRAVDLAGDWLPLITAERLRLALISRHLGLDPPWDSVWLARDDLAGLRRDSEITRRLGYAGRILAFPEHVPLVNQVYLRSGASTALAAAATTASGEDKR